MDISITGKHEAQLRGHVCNSTMPSGFPSHYPSPGTPAGWYSSWGKWLADTAVGVRSSLKASTNAGLCLMALLCGRHLTSSCSVYASSVWCRSSPWLFGSAWQPRPPRGPRPAVWARNMQKPISKNPHVLCYVTRVSHHHVSPYRDTKQHDNLPVATRTITLLAPME